jgi:transposase-like protein
MWGKKEKNVNNPPCPLCEQNLYVIKSGLTSGRSQRYRCQQCQGYFTPQPKLRGYDPEIRKRAAQLYLEGTSYRAIGRLLGVHNQTVINWIAAEQAKLPALVSDQSPTDYIEVDELFSRVQAKKK